MGSSNDVVYPVHGGMEEWGYAASWFNQHNPVHTVPAACDHNQSVVVTPTSHRCLTFLVETTDIKTPVQKLLGDSARLFATPVPKEGQYVPIVMRQALALMEAVRPYSVITASSTANHTLSVRWLVGGCFEVDDTRIVAIPATPEIEAIMDETYARGDLRDEEYALLLSAVRFHYIPPLRRVFLHYIPPLRRAFLHCRIPCQASICPMTEIGSISMPRFPYRVVRFWWWR